MIVKHRQSNADTPRSSRGSGPNAEIVDELNAIEAEARETDKALRKILEKIKA